MLDKTKLARAQRKWYIDHKEETIQRAKIWHEKNPEKAKASKLHWKRTHPEYERIGLRYKRNLIRKKHQRDYRPFKLIFAPNSQIHHEWIPDSVDFRGIALVERDQHLHGFIDVIHILEGEITLFSEKEIRKE